MRKAWTSERGDTLIEVTIALAILAVVLLSSTVVATRAFRLGQTARERTAITTEAQAQMEALRSFRDNHTWAAFLDGQTTGTIYQGVANAGATGVCVKAPKCFHMELTQTNVLTKEFVPIDAGMNGSVPTSHIEIVATPLPVGLPSTQVEFTIHYWFDGLGGGQVNEGHIKTLLSRLTADQVTPPCSTVINDIVFVLDMSDSMTQLWDPFGKQRITKLKEVAADFISSTGVGPATTHEGIISFNATANLDQALTGNEALLQAKLNGLGNAGGTKYLPALEEAVDQFTTGPVRVGIPKVLIFISDGEAEDDAFKHAEIIDQVNILKGMGVQIYTIGITSDSDVGAPLLIAMAGAGNYASARNEADLDSVLGAIAGTLGCP